MSNNFDLRKFLKENKLTSNSRSINELGDLGFNTVQDYVENKYGKDVLNQIYDDLTRNEWDYFVSIDSKMELDDYVSNYVN
jgi:hypothetical protein